jgi:hypothetical protein
MDRGENLPDSFEEGAQRLRPSTALEPEGKLTVGWEVYGLTTKREPLTFRLSLVREGEGLFRRILEWTGLSGREPAMTLAWTEDGPGKLGPFFRSIDVDLPDLDEGRYLLRLELQLPFRSPVVSNRRILVS